MKCLVGLHLPRGPSNFLISMKKSYSFLELAQSPRSKGEPCLYQVTRSSLMSTQAARGGCYTPRLLGHQKEPDPNIQVYAGTLPGVAFSTHLRLLVCPREGTRAISCSVFSQRGSSLPAGPMAAHLGTRVEFETGPRVTRKGWSG